MTELSQYRFHKSKKFTLEENGVSILERNLFGREEYFVEYDEINLNRKYYQRKISWLILVLNLMNILYSLAFVASLLNSKLKVSNGELFFILPMIIINVSFIIWFVNEYKNDVTYQCYSFNLTFYKDNPTKEKFENFIQELKLRQEKYLEEISQIEETEQND